jgi:hypothetical protein
MENLCFWIKARVNGSFENPCISELDRLQINQREINSVLKEAFIGRLYSEKGVAIGYQALLEFKLRNELAEIQYIAIGEGEESDFL